MPGLTNPSISYHFSIDAIDIMTNSTEKHSVINQIAKDVVFTIK